jgi:hypothetical protein
MRIICNKSMPDLLCISESWLNSGHEDNEFRITGYDYLVLSVIQLQFNY